MQDVPGDPLGHGVVLLRVGLLARRLLLQLLLLLGRGAAAAAAAAQALGPGGHGGLLA